MQGKQPEKPGQRVDQSKPDSIAESSELLKLSLLAKLERRKSVELMLRTGRPQLMPKTSVHCKHRDLWQQSAHTIWIRVRKCKPMMGRPRQRKNWITITGLACSTWQRACQALTRSAEWPH